MKRTASAVWQGTLKDGSGTISTETGALSGLNYSFKTRFEGDTKGTNPEELLGAAHAGCFAMAFSHAAAEAGFPVERADAKAEVELKQIPGGFEIPSVHLTLKAKIPGIDQAKFEEVAQGAKANCPLSKVLRANITLDATLEN
jgi:lipoyl-dependent peroxiredoxin